MYVRKICQYQRSKHSYTRSYQGQTILPVVDLPASAISDRRGQRLDDRARSVPSSKNPPAIYFLHRKSFCPLADIEEDGETKRREEEKE